MEIIPYTEFRACLISCVVFIAAQPLSACSDQYHDNEEQTMDSSKNMSRLKKIFRETKLVCFGRYALTVPKESNLIWGSVSFPSKITSSPDNLITLSEKVYEDINELKYNNSNAELTYNGVGPVNDSWQIRFFDGIGAKRLNLLFFKSYIHKSDRTFILGNATSRGQTEAEVMAAEKLRAENLIRRNEDELPTEDGFCIEHAFMPSSYYYHQEMINVGIYLPSFPDVTFSISSNKDAYADYSKTEFENKKIEELSLLIRIKKAQEEQGLKYPSRTVLREGKRIVQHWQGEESLIRRKDGVHDFEWGFVGTPKDVANPSELIVNMYSKVEHNVVGAAEAASVSDDEAIALWDKLLSGFKFRTKVPGAPTGSYYLPTEAPSYPAPSD